MTAGDLQLEGRARLAAAGVDLADLDAEWLLRHVLSCDRAALLAHPERPVSEAQRREYLRLVARRCDGVPVQHLVGLQHFWHHEFEVGPGALIPRPETEGVVEAALRCLEGRPDALAADCGTGTGCIALSIALSRPDVTVHAVDVSESALRLAAANRRRLGVDERRVPLHRGDLLEPLRPLFGRLELVASNPPYIDPTEAENLPREVRDHEPAAALFAPGERLSVYRRLLPAARDALRPRGWLVIEIGREMERDVAALAEASQLEVTRVERDLQGIPRVLVARSSGRRG